jgi:hypothetical protein
VGQLQAGILALEEENARLRVENERENERRKQLSPEAAVSVRGEAIAPEAVASVADPRLSADHNGAERTLRSSVIARKIRIVRSRAALVLRKAHRCERSG